jgi:uncharacterized protein YuzE
VVQGAEYDEATDGLYINLLDAAIGRTEALDDRRAVDYAGGRERCGMVE